MFRHVPPLVLSDKELTSGDKLLLSVIIAYAKFFGQCSLYNWELASCILRKDSEYIRVRLVKLERLGYIKRHNANSKKRTISITQKAETLLVYTPLKGLNVEFKPPHLRHTQLLILQHYRAFPTCHIRQRARFLGLSVGTLYRHFPKIVGIPVSMKPTNYEAPRPPRNLNTYNRGVLPMEDTFLYSRIEPSGSIPSSMKGLEGHLTVTRKAIKKPSEKAKRLKEAIAQKKPFSVLPKKKRPDKKPLDEIETVWNALPNVRSHKNPNAKVYTQIRRLIRALASGNLKNLIPDRRTLLEKMARYGVKPSQIVPLLTHKFTKAERTEVYRRLSQWRAPDAYPNYSRYMPSDLPSLIFSSRTHMSWFLFAYLNAYTPLEPYEDQREEWCAEIISEFLMDNLDKRRLRSVVKELTSFWEDIIEDTLSTSGIVDIMAINILISKYCDFLSEQYEGRSNNFNLGWFRPDSVPFRKFLVKIYSWYGNQKGEYNEWFYRRLFQV